MKIRISVALSIMAALALITGCASTGHFRADGAIPANSLLIVNHSAYTLNVDRNGQPWVDEIKGLPIVNPVAVSMPSGSSYIMQNCSSESSEKLSLTFKAMKVFSAGCLRAEKQIGTPRVVPVMVGTSSPGETIILTSRNF